MGALGGGGGGQGGAGWGVGWLAGWGPAWWGGWGSRQGGPGGGEAGRVGRRVGWYGPIAENVHTARKGVCNSGVKNTLQLSQNRVGPGYPLVKKSVWGVDIVKKS